MERLNFSVGVREYEVNGGPAAGGGVLRFNPSDPNVYTRFFEVADKLTAADERFNADSSELEHIADMAERTKRLLALTRQYDQSIKGMLTEVFGQENDFDALLGGVSLLAVNEKGERVVTALMDALAPIIEAGARTVVTEKVEQAQAQAKANRAQRRAAAKR